MDATEVLSVIGAMFTLALRLSLPLLLVSMVVGIIIAIFQAATQINEQTMTFVPKLLTILLMLGLLGSTMLQMLQDFLMEMFALVISG